MSRRLLVLVALAAGVAGLQDVYFDEAQTLVALGAGDPERAYSVAVRTLDRGGCVEDMLPFAARAPRRA